MVFASDVDPVLDAKACCGLLFSLHGGEVLRRKLLPKKT